MFEYTTVTQRLNTLKEFRTMSITPFPIQRLRNAQWTVVQTDELLPGDVVSIVRLRTVSAECGSVSDDTVSCYWWC
ncbi:hypothetical protein PUNSTDRAFT_113664 [Punctularia strigosozonata HHB-11173 SS5]|uniref:uncharacterized protein n=1 Tax=Punctularia strigosozonata (strain HHB-11173) TaxID=741275 RepID=UPI0004417E14|nr:uncharacterized protein PUNSTDRAFT_113664 [Punctularia strigosozonata HHB-11173 SS5]EIN09183.1 hypothetical protein PUNSTDRAFT_113664 [Punctularia strigosozonata HHB-11173 SS5]